MIGVGNKWRRIRNAAMFVRMKKMTGLREATRRFAGDNLPEPKLHDVEMTPEDKPKSAVEDICSTSFRDRLLGNSGLPTTNDYEEWISNDEDCANEEDMDADCPNILLSEKIKIHRPWKQSLIIKLLGRSIG